MFFISNKIARVILLPMETGIFSQWSITFEIGNITNFRKYTCCKDRSDTCYRHQRLISVRIKTFHFLLNGLINHLDLRFNALNQVDRSSNWDSYRVICSFIKSIGRTNRFIKKRSNFTIIITSVLRSRFEIFNDFIQRFFSQIKRGSIIS